MTELEHLTKLIESAMYWGADTPEKIAERLIEDGDVIVPPCKVGDTVYYIGGLYGMKIVSTMVKGVLKNYDGGIDLIATNERGGLFKHAANIFYLTREEAEAALAERMKA